MADQWKASIKEIAGVAVAMVDVTVTRTIFLDPQTLERVGGALKESGLSAAGDFAKAVQSVPADFRRFVFTPWSDAESQRFNLGSFSSIVKIFESRAYWRVDGTAEAGFTGILNFGGVDRKIDLSEAALPAFLSSVDAVEKQAAQDLVDNKIKREEWNKTKELCDVMHASHDDCVKLYEFNLRTRREREQSKREQQERQLHDGERVVGDKAEYTGDFPDGFGDHFRDVG
ncbi:hypothetical protein [Burkholderia sp. 567]|uniref:hypothetical protein n=1 Tax=Burkholderia sp. 567 TaxID=3156413 RepID=UPI003390FFBC